MNRRACSILLTTLTLTATAPGQTTGIERLPSKQGLTYQVNQSFDLVIVLASWRNVTVDFDGNTVLADATVVHIAPAVDAWQQIHVDLPANLMLAAGLYVQPIGLKTTPVLSMQPAPAEKLMVAADVPAGPIGRHDGTWSEDETEHLFATNLEWLSVSHLVMDPKVSTFGLYAEFIGRNNGYGLKSAGSKVIDGRAQVYLELKVPGPGEGDLDIVQTHQLMLDLGQDSLSFDVHVAITDGQRRTAFRPFGSYGLK